MIIKAANVTIMVKDMDRAIAFYEAIGFTLKERWGNHYAQLTAPDIVIGLHPSDEKNMENGSGNVSIGFTTDIFEETKALLQNLRVEVTEREEEGGRFLHFNDMDGTALYFIQPKW
jgi:catechol 2,3-dioxygenase-like lactoylglutathione lyase family enzyme